MASWLWGVVALRNGKSIHAFAWHESRKYSLVGMRRLYFENVKTHGVENDCAIRYLLEDVTVFKV